MSIDTPASLTVQTTALEPAASSNRGVALIVLAIVGLIVAVLGLGGAITIFEKPNVMVQIVAALWASEGMLGLILLAVCLGARHVAKELRRSQR